jgi:hypothetical protein
VAGSAWGQNRDLAIDLARMKCLSRHEFEQLPDAERYGMSYDLVRSSVYNGIVAVRLFSADTQDVLLGMLVIDYTGHDAFACMKGALKAAPLSKVIGSCGRRLAQAHFLREEPK